MSEVTLGTLRKTTLWPTVATGLAVIWLSVQTIINWELKAGLTPVQLQAVDTYAALVIGIFLTWSLARALRTYRSMDIAAGTFPQRYMRICKTVAYILLSLLITVLVFSGFIAFITSFAGGSLSSQFTERLMLTYIPLVLEAAMIFYAIYVGFMSKKEVA